MPELRWILLGLGLLLIAGLWWWEARRAGRTGLADSEREQERFEPVLGGDDDGAEPELESSSLPSIRARMDEREIPASDPPIVMMDDEPRVEEATPGDEPVTSIPLLETPVASIDWPREPVVRAPASSPEPRLEREMFAEEPIGEPTVRAPILQPSAPPPPPMQSTTQPTGRRELGSAAGSDPAVKREPAIKQKIVAIRIVAIGDRRFDGPALRAALEAEGLQFGKYSVFHREREDGRVLYSAASLVEPGSFNLDEMAKRDFPGVSLFAVFPGPVDAPQAFDDMLATARRLAEQLGGALQDERRSTLSAQRVLSLREELAHFQNVVAKVRDRQAG